MVEQTLIFLCLNSIYNSNLESREVLLPKKKKKRKRKKGGDTVLHCALRRESSTLMFNFRKMFCLVIIFNFCSPIMKKLLITS